MSSSRFHDVTRSLFYGYSDSARRDLLHYDSAVEKLTLLCTLYASHCDFLTNESMCDVHKVHIVGESSYITDQNKGALHILANSRHVDINYYDVLRMRRSLDAKIRDASARLCRVHELLRDEKNKKTRNCAPPALVPFYFNARFVEAVACAAWRSFIENFAREGLHEIDGGALESGAGVSVDDEKNMQRIDDVRTVARLCLHAFREHDRQIREKITAEKRKHRRDENYDNPCITDCEKEKQQISETDHKYEKEPEKTEQQHPPAADEFEKKEQDNKPY